MGSYVGTCTHNVQPLTVLKRLSQIHREAPTIRKTNITVIINQRTVAHLCVRPARAQSCTTPGLRARLGGRESLRGAPRPPTTPYCWLLRRIFKRLRLRPGHAKPGRRQYRVYSGGGEYNGTKPCYYYHYHSYAHAPIIIVNTKKNNIMNKRTNSMIMTLFIKVH